MGLSWLLIILKYLLVLFWLLIIHINQIKLINILLFITVNICTNLLLFLIIIKIILIIIKWSWFL